MQTAGPSEDVPDPAAPAVGEGAPPEESIRRYLVAQVARRSGVAPAEIDVDRPLEESGLTSRDAVAIAGELEEMLGRALPATLVWEFPTISLLSAALASGADLTAAAPAAGPEVRPRSDEPIAVVGIGCRFPGEVSGAEDYWRFLMGRGDAIREVPEGRWDAFDDGSPEVADLLASTTKLGGFLDDIAAFDARFFGITPREAAVMDPQQRLVLEVAWEALEHAGIAPAGLRGSRTGVFVGVSAPEYAAFTASDLARLEAFTATGAALSIIANRLSYLLDLHGPSMIVDTACSSSLVATHLAVKALRDGEADVALAGGVNLLLSPTITMTFDQAGGTASDGRCKAFDAKADGMVRAEGCGLVVLKRLSDAVRDGDRILAVVRGTAVNSDGRSNGLVAPNAEAQKALLRDGYATTGIDPREVHYVEAHGTGTLLGDPIEAKALGEVLGAGRDPGRPLLIGSVKSNLGHMEAAAGAAGLIKTVLALWNRTLPASLHYTEPNPHIPFDDLRLRVVDAETPLPARTLAGVSGFGFGGTNAHVILESAATRPVAAKDAGSKDAGTRAYFLSDSTADRIRDHAAVLAPWAAQAGAPLGDIAATLARRNGRGRARSAVVARDRAALAEGLQALADGVAHPAVVSSTVVGPAPGRPVWVFSGYGAQRPGMGQRLLEEEAAFAEAIDDLDPLFTEEAGFSLWDFLESGREPAGPAEAMPVLFGVQLGLARMWRSYGLVPAAVIGHSMGEIAAAVVAGALPVGDAVKVIVRRSKLLTRLVGGGAMAVLGASAAEVEELAQGLDDVHPAVLSSPRQTVVTGDAAQIETLMARAEERGLLARRIQAEGAGHSPQVDPLLPELREALADLSGTRGTALADGIRLYTTALDDPRALAEDAVLDAGYWMANLRNPVRLTDAVAAAAEDGHRTFVELNAHPILAHAVGETLDASGVSSTLVAHSLKRAPKGQETDDVLTFHTQLATLAVYGHRVALPAEGNVIDVPYAPWQHEHYWVEPRPASRADEHPLLGAHVELPGEDRHAWQAEVGAATHPWLAGRQILPAAVIAEMALAAAGGAGINSLWIERPLAIADRTTLNTTFAEADGRVELHARTPGGSWSRLASAFVDGTAVSVPEPAGEIPIAPAERGSKHYRVHPEVLDRCLIALAGEIAESGGWLPEAIGALRVYGPTHRGGRLQTTIEQTPLGPLGSFRLLSEDGEPLLEAANVAFRKATPANLPVPLADKLIESTWRPTPLPTDPADSSPPPNPPARTESALVPSPRAAAEPHASPVARTPADFGGAGHVVFDAAAEGERLVIEIAETARKLAALERVPRLWIVTRGAFAVAAGEAGDPRRAFVRALVRVLAFEHPALRATALDVQNDEQLRAELTADAKDTEVAYRDGIRYAARLGAAPVGDGPTRKVVRRGGAYIITGGYGGIGLVTARLLAERGAGRIVLSGRSGPSPDAEKTIAKLRETGVDVGVVLGDIAGPGVAERLVAVAEEGGTRLCGVVHGAAGMADRLITDLGEADLHHVWAPKVDGAWRLHEATLHVDLDWWLVHSSAAALLGSPGQASYAAANAALDALVDWRRAQGLPATTVNWGTWAQVGGAADLNVAVLEPIRPEEGVEALEALLAFDRPATGVVRFNATTALELFPEIKELPYFEALVAHAEQERSEEEGDWPGAEALKELEPALARRLISERVRWRIATVLGFAPERLDATVPLTDLGLDSLVAVRIKSGVEHDLGLTVSPAVLLQGASVADFETWAAQELGLGSVPVVPDARPNAEEGYVMPRDAAERLAVRIFEEVLGLEHVSVVADFFELGGHDHQADEVVALLVQELGAELNRTEVFVTPTAEHVAEVIRGAEEEAARQIVRPLQPKGSRLPFYSAHPAGGTTGVYQQLAALLGDDQPYYGLERFEDAPSVEERAARYAAHLQETQPAGPFRLGGWSFGGTLAYETARQLAAAGREVEMVVLFDAGLPLPVDDESDSLARRFAAFVEYVNETYKQDLRLGYDELAGLTEEQQFALVMERAAPLLETVPPAVLTHQLTSHQDTRSLEAYVPKPYDGRVVLYKATEPTPWAVQDARYVLDEANGFGALCSNLEIVRIPGTHHLNLLDPPGVQLIAEHLGEQLAASGLVAR